MAYWGGADVSAVLPAYQDADRLAECLASVAAQTVPPRQVVVADDGSTDHTAQVVEAFARANPHLEVVFLPSAVNTGSAAARNRAVEASSGSWLAMFDSDDISYPTRFERELEVVNGWTSPRHLVAVATWGTIVNDRLEPVSPARMGPVGEAAYDEVMASRNLFYCLHSSLLIRRDDLVAIGAYDVAWTGIEDIEMLGRLAERGVITCIDEELVAYRKRLGSMQFEQTKDQEVALDRLHRNTQLRRAGQPELTPAEHAAWRAADPWPRRLLRRAQVEGKHHYRVGSVLAINGHRLRGAAHLAVAGVLDTRRLVLGVAPALRRRFGRRP